MIPNFLRFQFIVYDAENAEYAENEQELFKYVDHRKCFMQLIVPGEAVYCFGVVENSLKLIQF